MKKLVNISGGEIYAIPLFLSSIPENKSFARDKFSDKGKEFTFCRAIKDLNGGGILIEIFDYVGELDETIKKVLKSDRLFNPICVSGVGIYKKRWKKIGVQTHYDEEKHSNFSEITLVMGISNDLKLWKGGRKEEISEIEAEKHEKWIVWGEADLEKRIIKALFGE